MNEAKYKNFLLKFAYWTAIAALVYVFFRFIFEPMIPFLIGLTVAALLQPVVRFLSSKLKIHRRIIGGILVILACLILAGIMLLIFIQIFGGVVHLIEAMPKVFSESVAPALSEIGEQLEALLSRFDASAVNAVNESIPDIISAISGSVTKFSVSVVTWASGVAVSVPKAMLATIISVIASIFITVDYEKITAFLKKSLPNRVVTVTKAAAASLKTILGNYVKSYLMIMLITFTEIAVGLLIIGVEKAFLIALIIAVFDILPIVGSGIILLPWTIITFIQGDTIRGIGLAVLYVVVIVARQIFEPKIIGINVGLHPLVTLFSMWIGAKLFGAIGLFGLPITVLIIKHLIEIGVIGNRMDPDLPDDTHLDGV